MDVAQGGLDLLVPQLPLHDRQWNPGLQQVRGVGMAKRMDGHSGLGDAGAFQIAAQTALHRGGRHGAGGGRSAFAVPPEGGEKPVRVAVPPPVPSQHVQSQRRQDDLAVLRTLALPDMKQSGRPVDVARAYVQRLAQPQAAGINRAQKRIAVPAVRVVDVEVDITQGVDFRGGNSRLTVIETFLRNNE